MSKKLYKHILAIILIATAFISVFSTYTYAETTVVWPSEPTIEAETGLLIDADTGAVLYEKNADQKVYPASTTKIVTAMVAIENGDLNGTITISSTALDLQEDASTVDSVEGEEMPFMDALYALLLRSGNEVANAFAEEIAGSIDAFAEMMNEYVESLGCTDTHFVNPTGLHDDNHYTTARDMVTITTAAIENEIFAEVWSTAYYEMPATNKSDVRKMYNRHLMLLSTSSYYYSSAVGGKTGHTEEAGYTLVTHAVSGELSLIGAVFNSSQYGVYTDTSALFDYAFGNFEKVSINDVLGTASGSGGLSEIIANLSGDEEVLLTTKEDYAVIPSGYSLSDMETEIKYYSNSSDGSVAEIIYKYGDYTLGNTTVYLAGSTQASGSSPKVSTESAGESSSKYLFLHIDKLIKGIIIAVLVALSLILLRMLYVKIVRANRKKRRAKRRNDRYNRYVRKQR